METNASVATRNRPSVATRNRPSVPNSDRASVPTRDPASVPTQNRPSVPRRDREGAVFFRQKRALIPFLALTIAFGATACRGKHHRTTVQNEEPPPEVGARIASSLKMSDAAAPAQLLRGFYGLESGSWRWTAGRFTVLLRPPLASAQRGAILTFAFSIPDVVIQKLKTVSLSATIGTTRLKSETYSKPGAYSFVAEIPAELLAKEAITVDFALDKSLPAGSVDQRELGVVATSVSLESK